MDTIDKNETNAETVGYSQLSRREQREQRRQERLSSYKQNAPFKKSTMKRAALWTGIGIVLGLIVFVLIKLGGSTPALSGGNLSVPVSAADWRMGGDSAKNTLVEYGDFQCPACGAYYPIIKQLTKDLGDKMLFVFRNFPLSSIHPNAQLAAQAAGSAGKQGKFWEMHDVLYEKQDAWASSPNPRDIFVQYAQDLKLNVDQFKKDLDASFVTKKISDDYQSGLQSNVDSTPSFYLNGKKVSQPPQTIEGFKTLISAQ